MRFKFKVYFILGLLIGLITYLQKPAKLNSIQITSNLGAPKTKSLVKTEQSTVVIDTQKSNINTIPQQTTKKSEVRKLVEHEALHLYDVDPDPKATENRLRSFAVTMSNDELAELTTLATNEYGSHDQRTLAVYLLTLVGPAAQQALLKVFLNPTNTLDQPAPVHSFQEKQQEHEYSIRTMALQAIEQNMHQTKNTFVTPENLKNSYLNGLLKIVRLGEKMRRPMLKEFIDKNLQLESL